MSRFRLRGRARNRGREEKREHIPIRTVVPNLVTSLAACAGVTSIAFASEGRFMDALWALLVACVCDGMDGRIARLLKASSRLGAELDSLADFVNFGVAPAMYMFFWLTGRVFTDSPEGATVLVTNRLLIRMILGCSLFYAMCDCFRLARFNTMLDQDPIPYWKHFFTGVPAPGGCWLVLTPAILWHVLERYHALPALQNLLRNPLFGMFILLFIGALMASKIPTISLKALKISRRFMRPALALMLLLIVSMAADFWLTMGVVGTGYLLTIPVTVIIFTKLRADYEKHLTSPANKG